MYCSKEMVLVPSKQIRTSWFKYLGIESKLVDVPAYFKCICTAECDVNGLRFTHPEHPTLNKIKI